MHLYFLLLALSSHNTVSRLLCPYPLPTLNFCFTFSCLPYLQRSELSRAGSHHHHRLHSVNTVTFNDTARYTYYTVESNSENGVEGEGGAPYKHQHSDSPVRRGTQRMLRFFHGFVRMLR